MEALYMSVLHRSSGLDMAQLDLPLQGPGQEVTAGEFGPVVAADRLRQATSRDHLIQHTRDSSAGEARIDFQRKALTGERVHDT